MACGESRLARAWALAWWVRLLGACGFQERDHAAGYLALAYDLKSGGAHYELVSAPGKRFRPGPGRL